MKKVGLSRRDFIRESSLVAVGTITGVLNGRTYAEQDIIQTVLRRAGNTDNDELRLEYLKGLFGIARGFFEKYAEAFPENKIANMYLGHPP
ncbi:MAG: hypothetical protein A2Z25_13950 [Planctomycetes bacterium RBG_16_55_9]|nr:MAG: hypothetical protein A2Z25_13950 [Planctomycetes bacterium RBG_16_55_9]